MAKRGHKTCPILLAGGSGSRLWPISRELYPKQLVNLIGTESLIQSTIKRLSPVLDFEMARVVCGDEHFYEIKRQLEEIGISSDGKLITEPCGRNTAPAILLAILNILNKEKDATLLVFPADHVVTDIPQFHENIKKAIKLAEMGYIVTFGIKPSYPETGYGYIEGATPLKGGAFKIKRFVEKPDMKVAERYIRAGNFFWNSGMFAFRASVMIREFRKYTPELFKSMKAITAEKGPITAKMYKELPDISIDYAIMEKTKRGVVLPSDFGWSDIGSWKSLYDILPKDRNMNVIEGNVIIRDTRKSLVKGNERLIVVNGVENVVVVETPDTVFVSSLDRTQDVKLIVNELKRLGRKECKAHITVYRPWGTYTVLEEKDNSKMKRIVIYPNAKLSLQMHYHRSEHWIVAQGTAKITIGDKTIFLEENQSTYIPKATPHRLENPGKIPLHIIEVQMGSYLDENDIVRFDDDFGRAGKDRQE